MSRRGAGHQGHGVPGLLRRQDEDLGVGEHSAWQNSTTLVHNGAMRAKDRTVRQSVTMPAKVASQVRAIANRRRLSASRVLVELVEEGLESRKAREKAFLELAERFRAAEDPDEVARLGDELGKMVFGE